jgi:hypothetical protein
MSDSVPFAPFVSKRRTSFPPWVRVPVLALAYGIGVPVTRTLEACGQWPLLLTRIRRPPTHGGFEGYKPSEHDVIACSYFKSGTNLLLQMAVQIAARGHARYAHIHDIVPWPEFTAPGYSIPLANETPWRNSATGLRIIKTHKLAADIPLDGPARYIAVVRDPKSVVVSSYHFAKALVFGPMMPSIVHWAEFFMHPKFAFGEWPVHVAGFWALRTRPNVLFMTYEEMTRDPDATVWRVARFMGVDLSDEEFSSVRHLCSFGYMKQNAHQFDHIKVAPWSQQEGATIRRGARGASGELLSAALQERIDDHCRSELRRLGCDFPYDAAFARDQ